jgi:predicted ATPase
MYKHIADLHEEAMKLLLNARGKLGRPFTFLLNRNEKEWEEGKWFDGNDRFVNIYFLEKAPKTRLFWKNNIQIGLSTSGSWNMQLDFERFPGLAQELAPQFRRYLQPEDSSSAELRLHPVAKGDKAFFRHGLFDVVSIVSEVIPRITQVAPQLRAVEGEQFEQELDRINRLRAYRARTFVSGFDIKNYKSIGKASIEALPARAPWIFLVGENGFGKTALLQGIAIGLYGNTEGPIVPAAKDTHIAVQYQYENGIRTVSHLNETQHEPFFMPVLNLAAYGPSRLDAQSESSENMLLENNTATYGLFHTNGYLKNVEVELKRTYAFDPFLFDALVALLKQAVPTLEKIEIAEKGKKVLYHEKDLVSGEAYQGVEFGQLASGVRNMINIVSDIFIRFNSLGDVIDKKHEADAGIKSFYAHIAQSSLSHKDLSGVVIIDELDLHLHPKWQKRLPTLLSEIFPNIQFIASTHSPIPLLGAPKGAVFLKVNRTADAGVTVERLTALEQDLPNLMPNALLSSPLFELGLLPVSHDPDEPIYTKSRYKDIEEAKQVRQQLEALAKTFTMPGANTSEDEKSR